jgi:Peptidase family M48
MHRLRIQLFAVLGALALARASAADEQVAVDRLLDRISGQEQKFIENLRTHSAILETYIQEIPAADRGAGQGLRDHYFLGRLDLSRGVHYLPIADRSEPSPGWKRLLGKSRPLVFYPAGFAQMILPDTDSLERNRYHFDYVRREFVGEIRCLLFDVAPLDRKATGRFIGRIWVDDREMRIVRFNGTYTNSSAARQYFHFDSWRLNVAPGIWVPAFIYIEESQAAEKGVSVPRFKAQTRLWSYNTARSGRLDELASIAVEADKPLKDESAAAEISPLESQRSWERQAEINILERLEKAGLLAPAGPVDEVLNTVINNLIVTNHLNIQAAGRVLLTTPIETFSVGQTIVISRGLLDVLPDEASLAMVLSDELAHIALGHRTETHFAFSDQTMLGDADLLKRLQLARPAEEIAAAGTKAVEMLGKSPYHDKLANAGLFLRALSSRAPQLPNLICANLGNGLASGTALVRMEALAANAPPLESEKLEQIAALPLGSRIRLDPWTNEIVMTKTRPVSLISARDKLPFEVTPFLIHLSRAGASEGKQNPASSTSAQRQR